MGLLKQDDFTRNLTKGLKIIGGMNTVIHCHHYNSRLQRTIEGNPNIDGKRIIRESAAVVYFDLITNLINEKNSGKDMSLARDLYSFLGFGTLDFGEIETGHIYSDNSHYVEGWRCGSINTKATVCRMTEGFLEGAIKAILGKDVSVQETGCMNCGDDKCTFKINSLEGPKYTFALNRIPGVSLDESKMEEDLKSNIDKATIVKTVMGMPLEGNNEGLIPAFNVYLAHTPQDFYNLICIKFVNEMAQIGLGNVAKEMLVEDAENCALNTFGGILDSEEWAALVSPMIKEEGDVMFGLIAVANALGWGRINITEHTPFHSLLLESCNGYEAFGYLELEGQNDSPQCFMLKGVAAGLMGLVYVKGDLEDRVGKYECEEICCLTKKDNRCQFKVNLSHG